MINTGDMEIDGIDVTATGKTAQEARLAGWQDAYRQAWARLHGRRWVMANWKAWSRRWWSSMNSLGPTAISPGSAWSSTARGRGRLVAAQNGGAIARSSPTLVIPLLYAGGVGQVYEVQGLWQRTWAEFNTGASAIDYIRPSGAGGESLLITAGQPGRRSRVWWRNILDQFGASNVVIPIARLERQWPGGPVKGIFTARYGADDTWLDSFTLTAPDEEGVPAMLGEALRRFDTIYTNALQQGVLTPDATLSIDHPSVDPAVAGLIAEGERQRQLEQQEIEAQARINADVPLDAGELTAPPAAIVTPEATQLAAAQPEEKSTGPPAAASRCNSLRPMPRPSMLRWPACAGRPG